MKKSSLRELRTPALLLDWAAAKRNIATASKLVEGKAAKLRPHFKTHKCVPLALAQLAGGNCVGMAAATVDEATALVDGGVQDVLIANQVAGDVNISRLVQLARKSTLLKVAVGSHANAKALGAAARAAGVRIGVLVDLNIGIGRWGVEPHAPAVTLAREIAAIDSLRFEGLEAYHGSCAHLSDPVERDRFARATMQQAVETKQLIESAGLSCPIVSGAGTGTFMAVLDLPGVTELQLGSYVVMDWIFQERMGRWFEIALSVQATVLSVSLSQFVIDVGLKGLGNKGGPPRFPAFPECQVRQFAAEEHTVVSAPGHSLRVGDAVRVVPSHAGATMNLYRQIVVHDGDVIREIWPVSATGYELNKN